MIWNSDGTIQYTEIVYINVDSLLDSILSHQLISIHIHIHNLT